MSKPKALGFLVALSIIISGSLVPADEGMWLLNNLPLKQLKDKYNFVPTAEWIEQVQKSSARMTGCSASFVSADGLLKTNWHCAEAAVQALSTAKNNYYQNGFYAGTLAEELKTNIDNVRVLMRVENRGVKVDGLYCEDVVFYQGGQYQSYCYKVYNDIRLVFSLERSVGFFGGDADNFEYPRYTLDVAFLRVYENGKPAKTPFHFKWSKAGAKPEELIFVSGHPGSTKRLLTSHALKTERDVRVPFLLDLFRRREMTLQQFMLRGKEQHRIVESDLFSWQNSRKLYVGKIRGLQDPKLVATKEASEQKFFQDFHTNPTVSNNYANGLIMIRDAQDVISKNYAKYLLLVRGLGFDSELYDYAQDFVSGHRNVVKVNLEYEEAKLRDSLTQLVEVFGSNDPMIVEMLKTYGGPSHMAHTLVVNPLSDAMIPFVGFVRPYAKSIKLDYENALEQERRGYALLSDALFRGYGTNGYPDATFTLRLSFGKMSGYEVNGKQILSQTTIGGAYEHAAEFGNSGDYKLPSQWYLRKKLVRLTTPLDFVSDLDITGGNSGSPVFNKNLEIVGLVFDSNIEGLVSDYDYDYSPQTRAIAVHSAGIIEILSKIYRANRLVLELTR